MSFLVSLAWFVASTVVSALLAPKAENAKASGLGDFTEPTALEGRPLPLVLGTCKLAGPNVMWWGNLSHGRIRRKSGLFSATTIGYKYYLGMQLGLCLGPIDAIEDIYVGDKSLRAVDESYRAISPVAGLTRVRDDGTYDTPGGAFPWLASGGHKEIEASLFAELFGGEEREGGLGGRIHAYFGAADQPADPYLVEQFGGAAPAYRGLCYLRLGGPKKGFYVGTQKTVKDWAPVVRHCPVPCGLSSAKGNIGGSANIAYACAWLLTLASDYGGFGVSASRLDLPTFQAAADRLYAEGLGISLVMDTQKSRDAWLSELLRIADGVLYTDPQTGLWTLKLIRADYDPATLPELTVDDTLEAPAVTRPSWGDTINQVLVRYTDRSQDYTTRTVQARDAANIRARGGEVASETVDYLAVDNAAAANRLVARDLQTRAYPLAQIQGLKANRKAWAWRPGQPFKLTWPAQGYSGMVCRVTKIRYGTLENPEITLDAVEDIFGLEVAQYAPPPASGWVDPTVPPSPCLVRLLEAPRWVNNIEARQLVLAAKGDPLSTVADVWVFNAMASPRAWQSAGRFEALTPSGTLAEPYSAKTAAVDPTGFRLAAEGLDLEALAGETGTKLALIDDELIGWESVIQNADGTWSAKPALRGALDTVPADHAAGARVWFLTSGAVLLPKWATGGLVKVLPESEVGKLTLDQVPQVDGAAAMTHFGLRYRAPMPPADLKLNGQTLATFPSATTGTVSLAWSYRAPADTGTTPLVPQSASADPMPPGTYFNVEVWVGGTNLQDGGRCVVSGFSPRSYLRTPGVEGVADICGLAARADGSMVLVTGRSGAIGRVCPHWQEPPARLVTVSAAGLAHLSGSLTETGYVEGGATAARFHGPTHAVLDGAGNVYTLDNGRYLRRVAPDGTTSLWVDLTAYVWAEPDASTGGVFAYHKLTSLATDGTNLYVFANRRIFKVAPDRSVTLLAGNLSTSNGVAEDGVGSGASFVEDCVIAASSDGYVYVHGLEAWVDSEKRPWWGAVRLVSPTGVSTLLARPGSGKGVQQIAAVGTDLYSIGRDQGEDWGWNRVKKTTRAGLCTVFAAIPSTLGRVTHLAADPGGHLVWAGYDAAGWNLCFGRLSATGEWSTLWTDTGRDGYSLAQRQAADPDPTKPVRVRITTQDASGVVSVPAWTPPFVMG